MRHIGVWLVRQSVHEQLQQPPQAGTLPSRELETLLSIPCDVTPRASEEPVAITTTNNGHQSKRKNHFHVCGGLKRGATCTWNGICALFQRLLLLPLLASYLSTFWNYTFRTKLLLIKELIFGVLITVSDICTDILAGIILFKAGDIINGSMTFSFILMPCIVGLILDIHRRLSLEPGKKFAWQFYHYLPCFSTYQHLTLFHKLLIAANKKEELGCAMQELEKVMKTLEVLQTDEWIACQDQVDSVKKLALQQEELRVFHHVLLHLDFKTELTRVKKSELILNAMQRRVTEQEEEITRIEQKIALFKIIEGLAESMPQSILQLCLQNRDGRLFNSAYMIDMVTVLLSLVSMIAAWTTLYLKMPYYKQHKKARENTIQEEDIQENSIDNGNLPFQTSKNLLWAIPVMAVNVVPKIFNLTIFIGSFITVKNFKAARNTKEDVLYDQTTGYTIVGIVLLVITMIYSLGMIVILRIKQFDSHLKGLLALNWATGPFGACIVIRPGSGLILATSLLSTLCHLLLLVSLAAIHHVSFVNDTKFVNQAPAIAWYPIMAVSLVISFGFSWVLEVLSLDERRQKFGLWIEILCGRWIACSLSCPDEEAFMWACENNCHNLVDMCRNRHLQQKNPVHLNGLHIACRRGHVRTVEALLSKERYHFLLKETDMVGELPFHWACKEGQHEIVPILAKSMGDLINAKNNLGHTGFIQACDMGHLNVINALLDLEQGRVDFNYHDLVFKMSKRPSLVAHGRHGMTGFERACYKGHLPIVQRLMEESQVQCIDLGDGVEWAKREGHNEIVAAIQQFYKASHQEQINLYTQVQPRMGRKFAVVGVLYPPDNQIFT